MTNLENLSSLNIVRVLHIDDEDDQLVMMERSLKKFDEDIRIISTKSPTDATQILQKQPIDCVVIDFKMPEIDGIELSIKIKDRKDIPIILYTGHGSEEVASMAFKSGIDDYVRKEFGQSHYQVLAKRIRSVIAKHQTEKSLQESDYKYRTLVEQSLQGIIIAKDFPPRFIFANPSIADTLGYTVDELVSLSSKELESLIHPEDRGFFFQRYKDLLEGENVPQRYEFRAIRKDGIVLWVEMMSTRIELTREPAIQSTFIDITERKKAENELKESRIHFQTLFNVMVDPVVIVDGSGIMIEITNGVDIATGYNKEELLGKNFMELNIVTEKSKSILKENLVKRMMGKHIPPYVIEVVTKDGRKIPYEVNANQIVYKGKSAVMAVFRDLSERLKIEKALYESEEKFRNLAEYSPNMIFINKGGRIVYANKKSEEIMGYSKEEYFSEDFNFLCLIAPESLDLVKSYFRKHMKGEDVALYDYTLITKEGKRIEAIISTKLINFDGEKAILGIVTDITDRSRYKKRIEALHTHASEIHHAKTIKEIATTTFNVLEGVLGFNTGDFDIVENNVLYPIYVKGVDIKSHWELQLDGPGITVRAVRTGESQLVLDTRKDEDYLKAVIEGGPSLSELAVPVKIGEDVVAIINLEANKLNAFTIEDQKLVEIIALHVATAIDLLKQDET